MMRSRLRLLIPLVVLLACNRDPAEQSTATTGAAETGTTASDTAGKPLASDATAASASPVHMMFFGTICHVLAGAETPRAVIINGKHPHESEIAVPESDFTSTPGTPFNCVSRICRAKIGEETVIQLLDGTSVLTGGPTKDENGFFDTLVPHLKTGVALSGDLDDVIDDAKKNARPPKGSAVRAYVELPPGRITAAPYWRQSCFKYKSKKTGPFDFGREIVLETSVTKPALRINGADFELKAGQPIDIAIANFPTTAGMSADHFVDHYEITKGKKQDLPTVEDCTTTAAQHMAAMPVAKSEDVRTSAFDAHRRLLLAEVPGCSNTQWP